MITTGIADVETSFTEDILKAASRLGIRNYRFGAYKWDPQKPYAEQLESMKPRLAKLAALNARYGMCAICILALRLQALVGASIWDLWYMMRDLDPAAIGINFDVAHATIEGGLGGWIDSFKISGTHMRGIAIKDFTWRNMQAQWTPIGDGMVKLPQFFRMIAETKFHGPVQMHYEYPLGGAQDGKTSISIPKEEVYAAMKKDLDKTRAMMAQAAVNGVVREAIIAACLTAMMILLFLGSWRSTLIIAISIPLSILTSLVCLSALGETINIMTLGGLALAVGILVDDATVTIENIDRNFEEGKDLIDGIRDGAAQIAVPALVSTFCICIVFIPMFFLTGVARFLFIPLAEAVVFAMLASYVLSRTLVPTLAMYLLRANSHQGKPSPWNIAARFQKWFEKSFTATRDAYHRLLTGLVAIPWLFLQIFLGSCLAIFALIPWLGQDFFPSTDAGQIKLHIRTKTAMRIEETANACDRIEQAIRRTIPPDEVSSVIDNIGLPYSLINLSYSTSAPIGTMDADILVSLKENHRPTADYVRQLRKTLPREFPGVNFAFLPADIISQILNFGLPAPIDVQVVGLDIDANRVYAQKLQEQLKQVPGLVDLHIHQLFDQPKLHIAVDRTKAAQSGFTEKDVANSMIIALSGSFQTTPAFWLNTKNGVNYSLITQSPQYSVSSLSDLENLSITGTGTAQPEILGDVASTTRGAGMAVVSHYNIQRTIDLFGAVQDRDLGGVASDVNRIIDESRKSLPRGAQVVLRGQVETMRSSFTGLLGGLALAIVLVYLLIVVNFQSWLDPFIIITALPAAMAGIVLSLFFTHTTVSVPALMGSIMCVGVATANSILVVNFAKERLAQEGDAKKAALEAGFTRFRPVVMTALAMIIGMVPMALGAGEGGEQNAPLGRAVIGGLSLATVATLFFVPAVFSVLHGRRRNSA